MKKINKYILISLLLVFLGTALAITGVLLGGSVYEFRIDSNGVHVSSPAFEADATDTYIEEKLSLEAFSSIEADVDFLDIRVIPQDAYGIAYKINSRTDLTYELKDDVLKITENSSHRSMINFQWFYIGSADSSYEEEYLEIYVPREAVLDSVTLATHDGDLSIDHATAANTSIYSAYGDVEMTGLSAASLNIEMEHGELEIKETTGDTLSVINDYGDSELSELHFNDTAEFALANGSLIIDDSYLHSIVSKMEYGNLNSHQVCCDSISLAMDNGDCKLTNFTVNCVDAQLGYGNATLDLTAPTTEYSYDLRTEYGDIDLEGFEAVENDDFETTILIPSDSSKQITINNQNGDIKINGF